MDLQYLKLIQERDIVERQVYRVEILVTDHFKMAKRVQDLEKQLLSLKHLEYLGKFSQSSEVSSPSER